nr:alanine racemase [Pseudomonas sp.]
MPRPIHAIVSPSALAHNLAAVRRRIGPPDGARGPRIWGVIKANAYGHGIERVLPGLGAADGLAMLDLDEAVRCREAGWGGPILMLEGFFEQADVALFDRYRLISVLHHEDQFRMLHSSRARYPLDIFLKLNSGMNRLGFAPGRYRAAFEQASALQQQGLVGSIGHMMHFANGDQAAAVEQVVGLFDRATLDMPGPRSVCNSAATLGSPQLAARTDWVRPGICLYGATPFENGPSAEALGLMPAMTLGSRLIGEQSLQPGAAVGYGGTFVCDTAMRVGIVACGYADGYPRHAPTGTPVVVDGVRTRLVGRVSMDMLAVDLTPVPRAGVGSPVTLWGDHGLSVDEVAAAADTIGYELLTAVAARVPMHTV